MLNQIKDFLKKRVTNKTEILLLTIVITLSFNCMLVAIYLFVFDIELIYHPLHTIFVFMLDFLFGNLVYKVIKLKVKEYHHSKEAMDKNSDN